MTYTELSADEIAELDGLDDWRVVLGAIRTRFRAGSFPAAAALVSTIAELAETAQHHPDVDLRYPDVVHVVITTHATGGLTDADVALARSISGAAAEAGAGADASGVAGFEVAIDTMDVERIRPFWAAILGYREDGMVLNDPLRIGPQFWFQQMDEPRTERQRFHIDVSVPHDQAQARIDAALAAGGTLVTDRFARSWWILADADGNEACVCTWQDRNG